MKLLFEEYAETIITIIGGLLIISIIVGVCLQTKIDILHSEELNKLNPILEKIEKFDCKDILVEDITNADLLEGVTAYSNTGKDLKDYIVAKIKKDNEDYYIEYILKYNNDFMIKKVKCYIQEEENEDNV